MTDIRPFIAECVEIDKICKKYGYGNVMEWASALWRHEMRSKGYPECICFVPTCQSFIKPEYQNIKQHEIYDSFVARILGGKRKMADFITKAQYEELEDINMCCGAEEFNKLLEKYTGMKARPYTAYQYFDRAGDYVGDSNENGLDELLQAAYVEE